MGMERNIFRIVLNMSPVETKLAYLNLLIREKGTLDHMPESIADHLANDVVLSSIVVETGSDGVRELKQTVDLGAYFNDVVASLLRQGKE